MLQPNPPAPYYGGRLIHNYSHGNYSAGRHWSSHPFSVYLYPAFILKFFYSPWNTTMKNRKLQIGPTFSKHSIQHGLSTHHLATLDELERNYISFATSTTKGETYMLLTKKQIIISSSFILIASLCTITLLTKQHTQLDSSPTNIEAKETITLSSSETNEIQTFRSSSVNDTHTFRGSAGTLFDFNGLGDLKVTVTNIGTNTFTYSIKSPNEDQLVKHTIQPNGK